MIMKKIFIAVLILFTVCFASAQQKPQYTQYIFNYLLINPAVTGIENYTDAKAVMTRGFDSCQYRY